MRFLGGPAKLYQLGIDYQVASDIPDPNGGRKERYVLSSPLTPEQESELSKYENVKISKNGATYKFAPEQKYDVLYISYTAEEWENPDDQPSGEETAEEAFDDEGLNEDQILAKLQSEVGEVGIPGENLDRYTAISNGIPMVNSQVSFYRQLKEQFPEDATVVEELINLSLKQVGILQSLIQKDPEVSANLNPDAVSEPIEETPAEEAFGDENTGVNPTDTRGAYTWFQDNFDKYYNSDEGALDEAAFNKAIASSGYSEDLINWIWYNLGELSDDGYSYEEFISLCGEYPGEGNWEDE